MTATQSLVSRISTIEIPVSNLKAAVEWYERVLGLRLKETFNDSWKEAMLHFQDDSTRIFLVQTDSDKRLTFNNTNNGYIQSIIDFYTEDLVTFHQHLIAHGVTTNRDAIDLKPGEISGFGFFDPDGNSLGATNMI